MFHNLLQDLKFNGKVMKYGKLRLAKMTAEVIPIKPKNEGAAGKISDMLNK